MREDIRWAESSETASEWVLNMGIDRNKKANYLNMRM